MPVDTLLPSKEALVARVMESPLGDDRLGFGGTRYLPLAGIPTAYVPGEHDIDAFAHEAGHMLDFWLEGKPERLGQRGFGLRYKARHDHDPACTTPKTTQGLLREARTFGIQLHLLEMLGYHPDPHEFFEDSCYLITAKFPLEDAWNVPPKNARSRIARVRVRNMYYQPESQEKKEAWREYSHTSAQDRRHYVLKEMVRSYTSVLNEELLKAWGETWKWMDDNLPLEAEVRMTRKGKTH